MKKRTIKYKMNSGEIVEFDISKKACHPFGFYHGDRILSNRMGEATVIGVYENNLWYHYDGTLGACFNDSCSNKAEFKEEGYELIRRAAKKDKT